MNYTDILRSRRKTPNAVWHKLRTAISTDKYDFFAAFEGEEDEVFYEKFLGDRFPARKYKPLICDGKGGVLALYEEVKKLYGDTKNVFFFIDSDHDKFIGKEVCENQIFVTCGYSIESYIYDVDMIMSVIAKNYNISRADELRNKIREDYFRDKQLFEMRSNIIMSYLVALRSKDESPEMGRIGINSVFEFTDIGLCKKNIRCSDLLEAANVEALQKSDLSHHVRALQHVSPKIYYRGKWISQFIQKFISNIRDRYKEEQKLNGKKLKPKIELNKNNIISIFVEYMEVPERLSLFLDKMEYEISIK